GVTLTSTGIIDTNGNNVSIAGVASGAGGLTKNGTGTLTLSNVANTYTGQTTINAGTVSVAKMADGGTNSSLGATVAATPILLGSATAATLSYTGGTDSSNRQITINGTGGGTIQATNAGTLTLTGALNNSGNLVTFDANTGNITESGVISGAGGLTKTGTGTLTLSGNNNYAGATTINAGTLVASNDNALGTTAAGTTVASGATLEIASGIAIGAETLNVSGAGVGSNGALVVTSGSGSLAGAVTLGASASIGGNGNLTLSGTVNNIAAGTSTLTQVGSGTLTFSNTVGATNALTAVTTSSGQTTAINGGSVSTTGAQTYGGIVTSSSAITLTSTGGGNITANNSGNDFNGDLILSTSGSASIVDSNALALGASSVDTLTAQTLTGNLTLNGVITASGSGDSIVLAAAQDFVNNVGAGALSVPGSGRWLVYSTDPASDTFGGLASGNQALWNRTYPAAVTETGNRYVFSSLPTLTFTSTDVTKTYGDDATAIVANAYMVAPSYTFVTPVTPSGFVDAATYGNVFTQDTAANTFTGTPSVTSPGAPATAHVAGNPYAINVDTTGVTSPTGYAISANSTGLLTVTPRPVTLTVDNQGRAYGSANPSTGTATLTSGSFVFSDTVPSIGVTSPLLITDHVPTSAALSQSGAVTIVGSTNASTASDYNFTFNNGTLTVTPRPVTLTVDNQGRAYGSANPSTGTATLTSGSFVFSDTV
ncbi:MAG: beta strand repeat-containing protein, partial [Burkholderiales bacterium]